MLNMDLFAAQVATLAVTPDKIVTAEQMKRFMFSVLKSASESNQVAIGKGLSVFIGDMLYNIYDFEDINPADFEINDAHWEIMSNRNVTCKEIAAHCMASMKLAETINNLNEFKSAEVAQGVIVGAMSFADIMCNEVMGIKMKGNSDEN